MKTSFACAMLSIWACWWARSGGQLYWAIASRSEVAQERPTSGAMGFCTATGDRFRRWRTDRRHRLRTLIFGANHTERRARACMHARAHARTHF